LLESAVRNCDNFQVKEQDVTAILDWEKNQAVPAGVEVAFKPARVILQVIDKCIIMKHAHQFCEFYLLIFAIRFDLGNDHVNAQDAFLEKGVFIEAGFSGVITVYIASKIVPVTFPMPQGQLGEI